MAFPLPRLDQGTRIDAAVPVAGSKSVSNRALLLAALASGTSRLSGGQDSDDTCRMRECLRVLGIPVHESDGAWVVEGGSPPVPAGPLPVGASGTTLRFLIPWLALRASKTVRFVGDSRLFERPLGGLLEALQVFGVSWDPLPGGGILHPSPNPPQRLDLIFRESASSQFLTGLAMTAAALPDGGCFRWTAGPSSFSYLQLTACWMRSFGCESRLDPQSWMIPGQSLRPAERQIPGDWSSAAVFLCAAAVTGGRVMAHPLDPHDSQGDRAIVEILEAAGCRITWPGSQSVLVEGPLEGGLRWNLEQCPDLGPVLAATAALAPAPSTLTGLQTLPLKECDRLEASAELVRWLGGQAEVVGNHTLKITPNPCHGNRTPFDPRNDHRMAFAAALGGLCCGGELLNPGCVVKTMPQFWQDWGTMIGQAGQG